MTRILHKKGICLVLLCCFVFTLGNDVEKEDTTIDIENSVKGEGKLSNDKKDGSHTEKEINIEKTLQEDSKSEKQSLLDINAEKEKNHENSNSKNVEVGDGDQPEDDESPFSTEDPKMSFLTNIWKMFLADDLEKRENIPTEKVDENVSISNDIPKNMSTQNIDSNVSLIFNTSVEDVDGTNKTEKKFKFHCVGKNLTGIENVTNFVKIVNSTGLLTLLNFEKNDSTCDCVLVLFYAPWCPFCAQLAPSYNALARAFPQLEVVAVDAAQFSNLNARFGTVLVPNILLFHHSRAFARYNQTERSLESLVNFIHNITGLEADVTVNVTEADVEGPLSSVPTQDADFLLYLAWLFVVIFTSVIFVQSSFGQQWINKVCLLWQEHQHID